MEDGEEVGSAPGAVQQGPLEVCRDSLKTSIYKLFLFHP